MLSLGRLGRLSSRFASLHHQHHHHHPHHHNVCLSTPQLASLDHRQYRYAHQGQEGFFSKVLKNLKDEYQKDKGFQKSYEEFKKQTQKLEETEALKDARKKFEKVVEEDSIKEVNKVIQDAADTFKSGVDKAKQAEFVKKTMKITETISDNVKGAAEGLSKQGEKLKDTSAYKSIQDGAKTVSEEMENVHIISSLYKAPTELLKRAERSMLAGTTPRVVEPNADAQDVELHKDSKWSQTWSKFKEDNPYVNKVFEFKMKYDESDNPLVRVTRSFVDRVSDTVGGLFQKTDLSTVLTEICKVDPNFDINNFLKDCETFIIPTILEAICQNRPDILEDWCHEAVFNVLSQPQKEAQKLGYRIHSKILDVQNVEIALGKMMDQGPVLVITFNAQQLTYVADSKGNVVEGDSDKIVQNTYVMAFCRDQNDLDPNTAWRLIDVAMQQSQFVF